MSKRQKIRLITIALAIALFIFALERIYNSRDDFQVTAKDASYYGIIEANLTTKEKLQDFEYLYDVLENNYPFFKVNERRFGVDWLGNKRKYIRMIKNTKNDAEFLVAMDRILSDLHNGHVNIFGGNSYRWFYKVYYQNHSGPTNSKDLSWHEAFANPHVMNRYKFAGDIEGIELYNEPVLETKVLIEDELAYMKIKSMAGFDIATEDFVKIREFLKEVEGYEKLIIDIRGNGGGFNYYWRNIIGMLIDEPLGIRYYSFFKDGHRYKYDPYKANYVSSINKLNKKILDQFPEEVKTEFNFYKTYYINISPWGIHSNPSEHINYNGKIYLLVDRDVFSSAELFASFAKDTGFATLVGEPTGGDMVFEEIPIIHLPKSKFVIRYSREFVINADGTINMETKTIPHIEVDPTPNDDFNKDECIQAVIRDKEN